MGLSTDRPLPGRSGAPASPVSGHGRPVGSTGTGTGSEAVSVLLMLTEYTWHENLQQQLLSPSPGCMTGCWGSDLFRCK